MCYFVLFRLQLTNNVSIWCRYKEYQVFPLDQDNNIEHKLEFLQLLLICSLNYLNTFDLGNLVSLAFTALGNDLKANKLFEYECLKVA